MHAPARHDTGLREICCDTETTGFDPNQGHRVIEIACVEIVDLMPTGREFHVYLDPERDVPADATRVHGLTREFLRGKPRFRDVAEELLTFIGDSDIIAHNASFDMRFLNAELRRARLPQLSNRYIDTVALAKKAYPGAKVTLNDLCRRFGIDLSSRDLHGALIDTQLLARVYLELNGGRERKLQLTNAVDATPVLAAPVRPARPARPLGLPSMDEISEHSSFIGTLKNALWRALPSEQEPGGMRP